MSGNNQFDGVIELSPEIEDNKFRVSSKPAIQSILGAVKAKKYTGCSSFWSQQ